MFDLWLEDIIQKHARKGVLLDSNLLLVYCVGAIDPSRIPSEKVTRQYNSNDFRVLNHFVGRFDRILTTPNIITEVSNLSGRLREDTRTILRLWSRNKLVKVLQEKYVPSVAAFRHDAFERYGLTDAAVSICGMDGSLTLTDDLDLSILLQKQESDCIHYTNALRFLME